MGDLKSTLLSLVPVILAAFSPVITAFVKKAVASAGAQIPNTLKPVINALIGALVAGLTGANPLEGVVGAQVGKSVRDQLDK